MPRLAFGSMLGLVGCGVAIVRCAPDPAALLAHLRAPHAWVRTTGADNAAAALGGAALWCVLVWLAAGLAAMTLARLPGASGRVALSAGRAILPAVVYRMLATATGVGVLLAPVAAGATSATTTGTLPTPMWPTSSAATTSAPPSPGAPSTPAPIGTTPGSAAAAGAGSSRVRTVTVHSGDSLWQLAEAELGPTATPAAVAAAWPRLYAANRPVIGPHPGLIEPGQVLAIPTDL